MKDNMESQLKSISPDGDGPTGADKSLWTPKAATSQAVVTLSPANKPDLLELTAEPENAFPANIDQLRATVQFKRTPGALEESYLPVDPTLVNSAPAVSSTTGIQN